MDKAESNRIFKIILSGYTAPLVIWMGIVWFLDIATSNDIISMFTNLQGPLLFTILISLVAYQASRMLHQIVDAKASPNDPEKTDKAQRALARIPRYFLYSFPVISLTTPAAMIGGIYEFTSFNYAYCISLYFFTAFIISASFFIQMVINLEKWGRSIPLSRKYNDLNIGDKFNLILTPHFIAVIFIILTSMLAIADNNAESNDLHYLLLVKSSVMAAIFLGIIFVNLYSMQNMLLTPVRKLHETMRNIVRGKMNIASRMDYNTRDELAYTAIFFNDFMSRLFNTIKNIQMTSYDIEDFTLKLDLNSKKYRYNAQKEDDAISDIARNLGFVQNSLHEMLQASSAQSDKIESIITEMTKAAEYGDELIEELEKSNEEVVRTTTIAQAGENSMNTMRNTMEQIHNVFIEIAEVLTFINDVAEKINLLSLNASIEAARAGDLGMGFSVVAQQIARLAEETKKSVSNINRLLENSDEAIKTGSDQILSGAHTVLTLLQGVENIEKLFGKLFFALKEELGVFKKVEHNVHDVKMDAATMERVTGAFQEKVQLIEEILSNVTDYSKGTLEATNEISASAVNNKRIVNSLKKKVTFFQVEKTEKKQAPDPEKKPATVQAPVKTSEKKVS